MSASVCSHLQWVRQPPKVGASIHKEECTQCFHTDSSDGGVDVCLTCFNGGCTGASSMHHSARHASLCHPLVLNIKKHPIVKAEGSADDEMTDAAAASSEPAAKVTKLAIGGVGGVEVSDEPQFFYETGVRCLDCHCDIEPSSHPDLARCVEAVMAATSSSRPTEIGWEDKVEENCPHCSSLQQVSEPPQLASRSLTTCKDCDVKDDMWLCLTCGALGCSRKQMIGNGQWSKGNAHAREHAETSGHQVVLKVGTLTAEGRGDCYCYACDNTVVNPHLIRHVGAFGIPVDADTQSTVATTQQQNLDLNLKMNWSLVFEEDGREATLAFGPGHTGLANIGNSCYMASVLQVLLAMPHFHRRYFEQADAHLSSCAATRPAECFLCQMSKLALGMLSGRYDPAPSADEMEQITRERTEREERNKALKDGAPVTESSNGDRKRKKPEPDAPKRKPLQSGVAPRMFKTLVAGRHPEFSSARQQDSFEYIHFLLDYLKQKEHALAGGVGAFDPFAPFAFVQEERLQCTKCNKVRYATVRNTEVSLPIPLPAPLPPKEEPAAAAAAPATAASSGASTAAADAKKKPPAKEYPPVSFGSCLAEWSAPTLVEAWGCPSCGESCTARKSSRFASFPPVLLVHMRRFVYEGWVPEKLDIAVKVAEADDAGQASIQLDDLRAKGIQPGEVELPKDEAAAPAAAGVKQPDATIVAQLEAMGFGNNACKRAALAVDNANADAAASWLFGHMDDADLNDPLPAPAAAASSGAGGGGAEPSAEAVSNLSAMGFDERRCKHALKQCGNDAERAVEWLFSHAEEDIPDENAAAPPAAAASSSDEVMVDSAPAGYELFAFVTHMGKSTGSGHYIAHVLKEGKWLQFNDHKVSFASQPMRAAAHAYLSFWRRVA